MLEGRRLLTLLGRCSGIFVTEYLKGKYDLLVARDLGDDELPVGVAKPRPEGRMLLGHDRYPFHWGVNIYILL